MFYDSFCLCILNIKCSLTEIIYVCYLLKLNLKLYLIILQVNTFIGNFCLKQFDLFFFAFI